MIPGVMDNWFKALACCYQMVEKRMMEKPDIRDIMSTLLGRDASPHNGI